jgi:phytoene synthase
LVREHKLPRAPFDALLEGFAWDAQEREYRELSDVLGYSARVASAVGVVMTMLMGVRNRQVLARACDLGAAMQLTNIARDVAEDAGRSRCYLPAKWLAKHGIDSKEFIASPQDSMGVRATIESLLNEADRLYARSEGGMPYLPVRARAGIYAARLIYADIGRVIRERQCNPMAGRAVVGTFRKLRLAVRAFIGSRTYLLATRFRRELAEAPLDEMRFLLPAEQTA